MQPEPTTTVVRKPRTRFKRDILTPEYVESLKAYSELLFKGGLCPKSLASSRPESLAALIEIGRDVGLPRTMAISWIAIVNGKPSIYGDAGLALIRASGLLEDLEESFEGAPGADDYTAICRVKRAGAKRDRVSRFAVADAKRANLWGKKGPWTDYPERQMMWRARGFACRDEFQDVLCGLVFVEESQDYQQSARPNDNTNENPEKVSDTQLNKLLELRDMHMIAKGIRDDDDESFAEWKRVIKPFGVESARELSGEQASELIHQLARKHDPFTHPPIVSGTEST